ncbi:GLPGLI family protein [Kaistella sp. BT6-1-3]|uniref:GLPGLI family protein n=1 Tax=Kaistella yananensis TaxID=2989820 RepID=A0ABT3JPS4_9FLAO|nr:GLPGLI family protein [Kaistella yananensis]MCW4452769.1 GLPGLI family protein [Kaistella yananensis]
MKYLLLIFTFSFGLISAQTHRFIYEFKYKQNPKQTDFKKENMTLDINPENIKFYNYHYVTIDSTNITKGQNSQLWDTSTPVIVRLKNSNTNKNYTLINDVFVFETEDKINWNLEKETKKFENYTLQKATTNFGGRNWTAWFSKEINVPEGPYKFHGLPGLIFQIFNYSKINLSVPMRKNQHGFVEFSRTKSKIRKRIETNISQLCGQFTINVNFAKTFQGLATRIVSKITSFTMIQYLNFFVFKRSLNKLKVNLC